MNILLLYILLFFQFVNLNFKMKETNTTTKNLNQEEINELLNQKHEKINYSFNERKINQKDSEILNKLLVPLNKNQKETDVRHIVNNLKQCNSKVLEYSPVISGLSSNLVGDNSKIHFQYKKIFVSPLATYPFITEKNSMKMKFNYNFYNKLRNQHSIESEEKDNNKKSFLKENILESTLSRDFKFTFHNLFKSMRVSSTTFLKKNLEVGLYTQVASECPEFGGTKNSFSYGVSIQKNLSEERPFIFRDYPYYDAPHYIKLAYSKDFNKFKLSRHLLSQKLNNLVPDNDRCRNIGLYYVKNNFSLNDVSPTKNNLMNFSLGLEHKKYMVNNNETLNLSLFLRKFFFISNDLILQSTLEAQNCIESKNSKLLPHQRVFVDDFKGIRKFVEDDYLRNKTHLEYSKSNWYYESFGVTSAYKFYNKLYYNFFNTEKIFSENPSFEKSNQVVLPFIHCNFLLLPNAIYNTPTSTTENSTTHVDSSFLSKVYFSSGVGLSYISEYIALEAYYNAVVKKGKTDIKSSFGFNVGLD